jgi:hypothetical protein
MSHHESGWQPEGATETYNGFEVWDHGVHPDEVNCRDHDCEGEADDHADDD